MEHCAMTNYTFFRGKHSIDIQINNPGHWGFSLGVTMEIIGQHPECHYMQIFSDCSYGYFADSNFLPDEIATLSNYSCDEYLKFFQNRFSFDEMQHSRWSDGDIITIMVDLDEELLEVLVNNQKCLYYCVEE